jgi:CRP-like cAMP-binding protein
MKSFFPVPSVIEVSAGRRGEGSICTVDDMRQTRQFAPRSNTPADALLRLALFAGCSQTDIQGLLADTDLVSLPAATVIDRTGERARQFVGIVDGYVRRTDAAGQSIVLGPGDHIGARELLADVSHDATYEATTSVVLVSVFGPTFRSQLREIPELVERASAHGARRAVLDQPVPVG